MSKHEQVKFVGEDGEELLLDVVEQTTINNISYVLATDDEDVAYILKETFSDSEKEESVFEFVEDDVEFDAIAKVFGELLEDVDLV